MNEKDYQPIHLLGNGITKEFAYDWKIFDKTDLIVQLESVITGEITTPELGSDYDINIESMGGNVIFTTAPASDYYINISRQTSKYQSKGYSTSPGFQGSEIEKSFDIVSCCLQDMDYNIETFKSEFSAEINQNIEDYKTDTDEQIADFENEINSKLTQVDQAVQQLNRLDEILEECEDYAATSEEKAVIAQQSATSATNTLTEIIEEHQEALSDIILAKNTAKTEIQTLGIYKEGDKILYKDDEGNVHEFKNAAMSVGTLFWSFATADYVPEYALACDGTEYAASLFPGLWNDYLTAETPKLQTCTYEEYQQEITQYGACAKFAVDTTLNKFKVPTIKNTIYQGLSGTVPVVGNGKSLGLTDGTNNAGLFWSSGTNSGHTLSSKNSYGVDIATSSTWNSANLGSNKVVGVTSDATKSGLVAQLSSGDTSGITLKCFVVVANTSDNETAFDWSQWASSLAGKLNTDHSNDTKPYITETYQNGDSWYCVRSDGWIEQGGKTTIPTASGTTINFLKSFSNTNYWCMANLSATDLTANYYEAGVVKGSKQTTSMTILSRNYGQDDIREYYWQAKGF